MGFVDLDGFDEEAYWERQKAKHRKVRKQRQFKPDSYELYRLKDCGTYSTYELMSKKGTIDEIQAEMRILNQKGFEGFIVQVHKSIIDVEEKRR